MFEQIVASLYPRQTLKEVLPFLKVEESILLTGARQTGKTSLMYLLADFLVREKKAGDEQIAWLDMEKVSDLTKLNSLGDLDDFLTFLAAEKNINIKSRKIYVFIDEVQYINNASSFIKYLYDKHKGKLKFILSGSSSLDIKAKFSDRLTGRVVRFVVDSLSFAEFLDFKKRAGLLEDRKDYDYLLNEYLIYGGYPKIVLTSGDQVKKKLLSEIYSLYVKKDIRDIGGISDVVGFNKLVGLLAGQVGGLVNEVELANSSGLSRQTVSKYLFILENTFVLKLVKPFYSNPRTELVKSPKVYFKDLGLLNAVLDNFLPLSSRHDAGFLVENFVFLHLIKNYDKVNFWRSKSKAEVDFIISKAGKLSAFEIKFKSFKRPSVPTGLRAFVKSYSPKKAVVVNKNLKTAVKASGKKIEFKKLVDMVV